MTRRQFLNAFTLATLAAVITGKRGAVRAEEPKPCAGWCLEYISPPEKATTTVYFPVYTR